MNSLPGTIEEITTEGAISLVKVRARDQLFYSIIIDTPTTGPWLKKNSPVRILFKETEVMIAPELQAGAPLLISVRNQLRCRITAITPGTLLCELSLNWLAPAENQAGDTLLKSIITRNACEQLDLKVSDTIIALIKTNEISLAHD